MAMPRNGTPALLTEIDLAQRLNVSLAALRRWRLENRGPTYRKLGALVRYDPQDVANWLQACPVGGAVAKTQRALTAIKTAETGDRE